MKLFLLASALILTLGCYRKQKATEVAPYPSPVPDTFKPKIKYPTSGGYTLDTTIKPRYEYGARYSIWMPLNKPYPPLDTINMVIEELLLDRTGREAAQFRAILSKQFASLLGRPTVDSVKIELPKK